MKITLLYFDGCPNWEIADQRLAQVASEHPGVAVTRHRVETVEEAERIGFHGSPSIVVNGVDAFAGPAAGVGLACRLYATPNGLAGAPTLDQLRQAVGDAWHMPRGGGDPGCDWVLLTGHLS
jgi:hypothetical protein